MTEDLTKGEFVTEAELSVLRALWRAYVGEGDGAEERAKLASGHSFPLSLVERVEALLFPGGF